MPCLELRTFDLKLIYSERPVGVPGRCRQALRPPGVLSPPRALSHHRRDPAPFPPLDPTLPFHAALCSVAGCSRSGTHPCAWEPLTVAVSALMRWPVTIYTTDERLALLGRHPWSRAVLWELVTKPFLLSLRNVAQALTLKGCADLRRETGHPFTILMHQQLVQPFLGLKV